GKTQLGRFLSNFALAPFTHTLHGRLASVEGFWYYVSTGFQHECLRDLAGFEAKKIGKTFDKLELYPEDFEALVKDAITAKLMAHPKQLNALIDSELPFTHYYTYGGKVVDAGYEWIAEYHEHIR